MLCLLTGGVAVREDRLASDKKSSSFSDTSSDDSLLQRITQTNKHSSRFLSGHRILHTYLSAASTLEAGVTADVDPLPLAREWSGLVVGGLCDGVPPEFTGPTREEIHHANNFIKLMDHNNTVD